MTMLAYVGCRTTRERNARGEGIGVFRVDEVTGNWQRIQLLKDTVNPSFLAFDRTGDTLFAVHGDMAEASAFRVDRVTGELTYLNTEPCGGKNPCHLTTDPTNRYLIIANYASGTLGVLPIEADGRLSPLRHLETLSGELGPHKTQQKGLYPHHNPYDLDDRFIIVPDTGGDQVCVFTFDADAGRLNPTDPPFVKTRSGSGPRHIDFHPSRRFAYVANELDSTIGTYAWNGERGTLTPLQLLPTLPETYTGDNTTAEIWVSRSGRFVYISNRGHDSIAIFAINPETGFLTSAGWQLTGGKQPRFFAFEPSHRFCYAANEVSDTIAAFRVDSETGALTPTGHVVETGSPTCIVFKTL
jgi:6-phosphogluconolactonase